jgi:quinol-cytochrome oxidoreductase complex cytochrome b subunit
MVGLTLVHLILLHADGSTNPLGIEDIYDFIPFYPYFLLKDFFGFLIFLFIFSYLIFFEPNFLGHPDNYIKANALVTPPHIVPEWYFLPFYAILRAVPSKLGGVIAMAASIGVLFFLPSIDTGKFRFLTLLARLWLAAKPRPPKTDRAFYKGPRFRPVFKFFFSF